MKTLKLSDKQRKLWKKLRRKFRRQSTPTKIVLVLGTMLVIAGYVYMHWANNHFYHTIYHAGLVWPQTKNSYTINSPTPTSKSSVYVAIGDSLTAGVGSNDYSRSYPYFVAQQLAAITNQDIILKPMATPGYKTHDVLREYIDPAIKTNPKFISIVIGANDVHSLYPSTGQFQKNYEEILGRLGSNTTAQIFAVNIPYIGTSDVVLPPYSNYYHYRTKKFNAIIKAAATKFNATYIDLYTPTWPVSKQVSPYYSKDRFHPSADGYAWWATIISDGFRY